MTDRNIDWKFTIYSNGQDDSNDLIHLFWIIPVLLFIIWFDYYFPFWIPIHIIALILGFLIG